VSLAHYCREAVHDMQNCSTHDGNVVLWSPVIMSCKIGPYQPVENWVSTVAIGKECAGGRCGNRSAQLLARSALVGGVTIGVHNLLATSATSRKENLSSSALLKGAQVACAITEMARRLTIAQDYGNYKVTPLYNSCP
jgi:hypothetical protein